MEWEDEITAVLSRSTEPPPYLLTAEEEAEVTIKNEIFADITQAFPVTLGKHVSNEEREMYGEQDATLTYGEVVTLPHRNSPLSPRSFSSSVLATEVSVPVFSTTLAP